MSAIADVALTDHIQALGQKIKTYNNEQLIEYNEAVLSTFTEMDRAKANKNEIPDVSAMQNFFTAAGLYIDTDGDIAQN